MYSLYTLFSEPEQPVREDSSMGHEHEDSYSRQQLHDNTNHHHHHSELKGKKPGFSILLNEKFHIGHVVLQQEFGTDDDKRLIVDDP